MVARFNWQRAAVRSLRIYNSTSIGMQILLHLHVRQPLNVHRPLTFLAAGLWKSIKSSAFANNRVHLQSNEDSSKRNKLCDDLQSQERDIAWLIVRCLLHGNPLKMRHRRLDGQKAYHLFLSNGKFAFSAWACWILDSRLVSKLKSVFDTVATPPWLLHDFISKKGLIHEDGSEMNKYKQLYHILFTESVLSWE